MFNASFVFATLYMHYKENIYSLSKLKVQLFPLNVLLNVLQLGTEEHALILHV